MPNQNDGQNPEKDLYNLNAEQLQQLYAKLNNSKPGPWKQPFEGSERRLKLEDKRQAENLEDAELERLSQSNKLRTPFMWGAMGFVFLIIVVSSVMVLTLTFRGELDSAMGVAFSVTLGVQVVGILAIIAHYLFSVPESVLLEKYRRARNEEGEQDG